MLTTKMSILNLLVPTECIFIGFVLCKEGGSVNNDNDSFVKLVEGSSEGEVEGDWFSGRRCH